MPQPLACAFVSIVPRRTCSPFDGRGICRIQSNCSKIGPSSFRSTRVVRITTSVASKELTRNPRQASRPARATFDRFSSLSSTTGRGGRSNLCAGSLIDNEGHPAVSNSRAADKRPKPYGQGWRTRMKWSGQSLCWIRTAANASRLITPVHQYPAASIFVEQRGWFPDQFYRSCKRRRGEHGMWGDRGGIVIGRQALRLCRRGAGSFFGVFRFPFFSAPKKPNDCSETEHFRSKPRACRPSTQ